MFSVTWEWKTWKVPTEGRESGTWWGLKAAFYPRDTESGLYRAVSRDTGWILRFTQEKDQWHGSCRVFVGVVSTLACFLLVVEGRERGLRSEPVPLRERRPSLRPEAVRGLLRAFPAGGLQCPCRPGAQCSRGLRVPFKTRQCWRRES